MGLSAKQIGWIVLGLVVIGVSYYIGFVGFTETKMMNGDQGFGLYEVTTTYPIAGILGFIFGLGLMGNALGDEDDDGAAASGESPSREAGASEPGTERSGPQQAGAGDAAAGESAAAAGQARHCPDCGTAVAPDAEFCTECGQSLASGVA